MTGAMKATAESTRKQIELICSLEKNRVFTIIVQEFSISKETHKPEYINYRNDNNSPRRGVRATNTIRDQAKFFQSFSHNEVTNDLIISHRQRHKSHESKEKRTTLTVEKEVLLESLEILQAS